MPGLDDGDLSVSLNNPFLTSGRKTTTDMCSHNMVLLSSCRH